MRALLAAVLENGGGSVGRRTLATTHQIGQQIACRRSRWGVEIHGGLQEGLESAAHELGLAELVSSGLLV